MTARITTVKNTHECPKCGNWQIYVKSRICVHCNRIAANNSNKGQNVKDTVRPAKLQDERVIMAGIRYENMRVIYD